MAHLVIHFHSHTSNGFCCLCEKSMVLAEGLQLVEANHLKPVCRDCGKKQAPSLVALMDLAVTAERVGRIGRHTVFPPLASLLDLARAAENYLDKKPKRYRQAV